MKEIKMTMGYARYEFEPNKFYLVSRNNDSTYYLEFIDNTGKYIVSSMPKDNVIRLSTINKYLAKRGYDFKFVDNQMRAK